MEKNKNNNSNYEKDFHVWAFNQAENLKKGNWEELDIDNLVEEIETLGRSTKNALESYFVVLLIHLLKKEFQPSRRSKSWEYSIKFSRINIEIILRTNPSLKRNIPEIIREAYDYARKRAALETNLDKSIFPEECPWDLEEILKEE